jgi:hypothetical protein
MAAMTGPKSKISVSVVPDAFAAATYAGPTIGSFR